MPSTPFTANQLPTTNRRLKNTKFLVLDEADEMLFDCRNPEVRRYNTCTYLHTCVCVWYVVARGTDPSLLLASFPQPSDHMTCHAIWNRFIR